MVEIILFSYICTKSFEICWSERYSPRWWFDRLK